MVRPFEDGLAMHQLRYPDEVKPWSEVPVGKLPKAAPAELALASQIIDQLAHETFDPTQYTDEVKDRVRKLIAKKAKGGEIVAPPEAPKPVGHRSDGGAQGVARGRGEGAGAPRARGTATRRPRRLRPSGSCAGAARDGEGAPHAARGHAARGTRASGAALAYGVAVGSTGSASSEPSASIDFQRLFLT